MEWKKIKEIILEYSSLPLLNSFNGRNEKFIEMRRKKHSFFSIPLKPQNFTPPKLGRI